MRTLKNPIAALALTSVLASIAFAGETQTPPAPTQPPGERQGPGFASTSPGQMPTPPEANAAITEFAISVLESMLF